MQLTPHFSDKELGVVGCEQRIIDNATYLCETLLEPVRNQFGPVAVHDGYRDPAHNARVDGVSDSYHLYDGTRSAADISVPGHTCQEVFDWIRLESGLPFDEVIIETNPDTGVASTIHLQINSMITPRRWALVGETNNKSPYQHVEVK